MNDIVDTLVYPQMAHSDEIREYMSEPLRSAHIPGLERFFYPHPSGEFAAALGTQAREVASDPTSVAKHVFGDLKTREAILVPQTRGLLPDIELGNALCSATNEWLSDRWLSHSSQGRFLGTIRVNPADPLGAAKEIDRWASDDRMVQIGLPMQSQAPYGHRVYEPIWDAAERHNLPVAVQMDDGGGIELPPTLTGYVTYFAEFAALSPLNFSIHLASLIAEGAFERHRGLRFTFTDGGSDYVIPLMWRLDKDWRSTKSQTPWVRRLPSDYLVEHVRFCASKFEGPPRDPSYSAWTDLMEYGALVMYGSRYPLWTHDPHPWVAGPDVDPDLQRAVLASNASEWYRLNDPAKADRADREAQ